MRFNRREAVREYVTATKDGMSAKIAIEIADAELAAELQEAEVAAAAEAGQRGVGLPRSATARTPDPATPMDITPNPTPYRTRTAPASPSPAAGAAPDHTLPRVVPVERAPLQATVRTTAASFTPYVDQPDAQQRVPANVPACQRRVASQPSASTHAQPPPVYSAAPTGRAARPVAAGTASRQPTAGPSSARAVPSGLPTYASHAPGPSIFVVPVRPSPSNGFASHETVRTYTTFMADGTPCIRIIDNNDEDAGEGSSTE